MTREERQLREAIIAKCRWMNASGLNQGTSGNISARYGAKELSEHALAALEERNGCLLANHGMIALGANLDKAMSLAVELETIARQYYLSLALGPHVILTDEEIAETARGFSSYGLQTSSPKTKSAKAAPRKKKKLSRKR